MNDHTRIEHDAQKYVERIMAKDKPQPPVPGKANFHVAVANRLRMHPQAQGDKLLDEAGRLKYFEQAVLVALGLPGNATGEQAIAAIARLTEPWQVSKRAWPCGCVSMGGGTEWVHTMHDPSTGEALFNTCREGHYPGQLFDAWSGQQQEG